MRFGPILFGSSLLLATLPCVASSHSRRGPTAQHRSAHHSAKSHLSRISSQRSIDDGRATQLQTALISAGYLTGDASGHWDSSTQAAMQKYQADHGWQTKLIPDSRAIIKLGLGPSSERSEADGETPVQTAGSAL